ncbi:hypothetical protein [Paenibacillus cremeus]|uniref:Uncharacterized protein n=1 Tax=Paenibacillus cremeus TaxID=2163881 RepID=A0A559KCS4_9BACL|nr:hypothetical protein [Paenibacillus cremeus]TVY09927.1 hypothetical protein FPZ49_11185 [Paenibacillus cremeus]
MMYFVNGGYVSADTETGKQLLDIFKGCNWNNFKEGYKVYVNSAYPEINYDLVIDSIEKDRIKLHWVPTKEYSLPMYSCR